MKAKQTVYLKLEIVATGGMGALTLLAPDGAELESEMVYFDGNSSADLGNSVKNLSRRAETLYG